MNLTYHMIRDGLHSHHGKSWFVGDNNLMPVVIFLMGIFQPIVISKGIEPHATHLEL
jgi:hypothetical protein